MRRAREIAPLLAATVATTLSLAALASTILLVFEARSTVQLLALLFLYSLAIGGSAVFYWRYVRHRLPIAHNVAIIGFPQSGKTTVITALFREVFARRVLGVGIHPTGQTTIDRVNADLARIEKGQALGPTTDVDLFAYRSNVEVGRFPFSAIYKVEFGDFPGNDSVEYAREYGPWLHYTPFFKWVMECDALVFIVDLAAYLRDRYSHEQRFVAEMSSAIRAAWQHYVDNIEGGARGAGRRPAVLVFTKADLAGVVELPGPHEVLRAIAKLGFGETTPAVAEIDEPLLTELRASVEADFSDLIDFLAGETRHFRVEYTSCFGTLDGRFLGMEDLFRAVLPR